MPDEARVPAHEIVVLDRIEFNERFRYGDVAAEVAFLAMESDARAMFVECVGPRAVALQRLEQRWKARLERSREGLPVASPASDARPDLYDAQAARWEAVELEEIPEYEHLVVAAAQPLSTMLEQVRTALHR